MFLIFPNKQIFTFFPWYGILEWTMVNPRVNRIKNDWCCCIKAFFSET